METVIKTYMGLFFLMLILTTGISIVKAQNGAENARDFRTQACIQLEDSNYEARTINSLIETASENNYELEIELQNANEGTYIITKSNPATIENTKNINGAVMKLKYYYELPIFTSKTEHFLYGIAR